jgi:hypothetical protein
VERNDSERGDIGRYSRSQADEGRCVGDPSGRCEDASQIESRYSELQADLHNEESLAMVGRVQVLLEPVEQLRKNRLSTTKVTVIEAAAQFFQSSSNQGGGNAAQTDSEHVTRRLAK